MGKHAKLKEKQTWSEEKLHLENARKLRGIYFIDPEDTEFKETIKNAHKKLETSVAPAVLSKIMKIWKLVNLSLLVHHEDHITGKGTLHCNSIIWHSNLFLGLKP